jgi:FkbM family methyltransferase
VIVSLLGLTFLATLWGPARAVLLFAAGRAATCSLTQSIRSVKETAAQIAAFEQISNSSRLIRKDNKGLELWETGQGPFWIISDNNTRWFFLFLAEQETDIYGSGSSGVRPGDIVLDCGAHYGLFTRKALAAGAKLVVAIEPAPQNLECFRRNLSKEIAEGRVIVYPKGVWDKEDYLTLHIDQEESGADSFVSERPGGARVEKVPLTTIDRLVAELKLPRVDFIKMDIEGAERHAVTGARATLERHKPRMALAVYHLPDDVEVIPTLVSEAEPSYRQECGFCTDWGSEIRQDIMYFH